MRGVYPNETYLSLSIVAHTEDKEVIKNALIITETISRNFNPESYLEMGY